MMASLRYSAALRSRSFSRSSYVFLFGFLLCLLSPSCTNSVLLAYGQGQCSGECAGETCGNGYTCTCVFDEGYYVPNCVYNGSNINIGTVVNVGTIVGIVVGCVVGVCIITIIVVLCVRQRRRSAAAYAASQQQSSMKTASPMYPISPITAPASPVQYAQYA